MPDADDFLLPIVSADCDRLHLEARYNYEAPDTGSLWIGANYSGGGELAWELTPLVGAVIGDTHGIAPGYKGSLGWKGFELYSEGEYVLDTEDSAASFFYNWSELTYAPAEWFRFGLATQRIRAHASERDVQRGFLVGLATGRTSLTAYVLNPDDDPTVILAVAVDF
jgi:hypothetical protein